MILVAFEDFEKYGCVNCGCDRITAGSFMFDGETTLTCKCCDFTFAIAPKGRMTSKIGYGVKRVGIKGEYTVTEHLPVTPHPRTGIPKWHYENPDIKPENGGEYWSPRGVGYDLSGFVKSKQAGERLYALVKNILNKDEPETWLDYRENEPNWIQFKFSKNEFDIEKMYELTKDTKVITEDIIRSCVL
jgi:hypothetical protein